LHLQQRQQQQPQQHISWALLGQAHHSTVDGCSNASATEATAAAARLLDGCGSGTAKAVVTLPSIDELNELQQQASG
jgi:hypothetical protein